MAFFESSDERQAESALDGTNSQVLFGCRYGPCEPKDLEQRMKRAVAALGAKVHFFRLSIYRSVRKAETLTACVDLS